MSELPPITGTLLGQSIDDIEGTVWLLGHDLRSPNATVISTLEMLLALHQDDPDLKDSVRLMRGALVAARREYNMVCDLLDLARFELNDYQVKRIPTDLSALLKRCLDEEEYALSIKQLNISLKLTDKLMVDIEPELFERVFSAMIDNVIKFTVKADQLKIESKRTRSDVVMTFSDNGRKIFPDFEEAIMRRAPQWDKRQAGSRSSVGVGIPFVYHVLKAHDGTFTAKSDPQSGWTTFTLRLPAHKPTRGVEISDG
jgi:K+-sensing histidine kinase KdpD